jgi:hypothetical protein
VIMITATFTFLAEQHAAAFRQREG